MTGMIRTLLQESNAVPPSSAPETLGGYLDVTITLVGLIAVLALTHFLLERRRLFNLPAIGRQLVLVLLTLVGLFAIAIAWPGRNQEALQILGILIGAAVAFGSTTFIGHGLAGLMLQSGRPFEIGDWLQVEDHFGAVLERGLFHTTIQTPHLDLTTLPYLYLTSHPFTVIPARDRESRGGKVRKPGTRVSAEVSLGYETDHSRVAGLLTDAVERAELAEPRVHVMELGDFTVTYLVQGVTAEIDRLLAVRSRLREEILDTLHGADIEIASPTLMNTRAYGTDWRFMSKPVERPVAEAETPIEEEEVDLPEVVEAKTLETQEVDLEKELDELRARVKEAEGSEKERLEAEIKHVQEVLNALRKGEGPAGDSTPGEPPGG